RKIELPTRLRNRGLALDDLQHQRRLAPRRPTLDFFFHHHAHECLLRKVTPEQEITGSLHICGTADWNNRGSSPAPCASGWLRPVRPRRPPAPRPNAGKRLRNACPPALPRGSPKAKGGGGRWHSDLRRTPVS